MYIFKICESVKWCSLQIKEKKSFIDLTTHVHFFSLGMWMHADAPVIKPLEYTEHLANK